MNYLVWRKYFYLLRILGLIYHNPGTLPKILPFSTLLSKVIPLFQNWETIFINCLQWTIKNFDTFQKLQDGIDYILNLDKDNFLKHAVAFLNVTNEVSVGLLCIFGIYF